MGKKPRSELPKWNKRKKHKGQAPPRPLKDEDAAGKGRKRKRASSFSNDASDNKAPTTRYKKRKEQFETAKQKKSTPPVKGGKGGKGAAKSGNNAKPPQPAVEEEVEATEEDVQFFTENAENLAFLDSLPAQQLTESLYKKKKLRREDKKKMKLEENKLAAYEKTPRKNASADDEAVKVEQVRLPVKDKEGLVLKVKVEGDELVPEHVRKLREKARRLAQGNVIEIDDQENGKEKEAMEEDNEGELEEIEVKEEDEEEEEEVGHGQADDSVELLEEKEEDDEEEEEEEEEEDDEMDEDEEEEEEEEGRVDFDEDEDDEDEEDDDMTKSLKRMEKEQEHIEECKHRMAIIGSMIMTDSETNIVELKEMLEMCRDNTFTVRKYALLSTLAVFKDIIPGYRIRMATEKEKQMKVSRDQKQMRDREALLLNSYQQYLQMLDAILKGYRMHRQRVKRQRKNFGKKQANKPFNAATNTQDDDAYLLAQKKRAEVDEKIDKDVKEEWVIAIRCLSELLHSASHFNFSWNIVSLIVPLMNADDDKLSQLCCASVVSVFENDTRGSITLQTVKLISQMVKAKSFNVRNEVLATFLHIKFLDELKEGEVTLEPTRGLSKKEKSRMTKRKFKAYKEMREIEQEMREAEAEQTKEEKKRVQTEILRAAFVTYFRILKKAQKSPLLPSVLEGLARYTHFISVDFITDIVVALRELIGGRDFATQLSIPVRLQCAISALEMTQKGSQTYSTGNINVTADTVVHVDLKDLYTRLYEVLLEVPPHTIEQSSILLSLLRCLNLIARDRKQLSASRTAAFVKRIATLTLQLPPHATLGLLSILTDILNKHPKIQQLFDSDHDGSGVFMPELNDPEHCNALASTLWEFALLKSHYHPHLQEYTIQFLKFFEKQCQAIVGVAVPQQHALTAETLYSKFDYQASGLFNPPMQKPPPHPYDKLATKFSAKAARQGRKNREKKMYVKPKEQSDFYQFLTLSSEAEVDMNDFDSYAEELTSFWDLTQ